MLQLHPISVGVGSFSTMVSVETKFVQATNSKLAEQRNKRPHLLAAADAARIKESRCATANDAARKNQTVP